MDRICPAHRCWAWSTSCKHEVKLRTVRDGKPGWECDKCDGFWSDEFLSAHPQGSHEFTEEMDEGWVKCKFCDLQRSKRPLVW